MSRGTLISISGRFEEPCQSVQGKAYQSSLVHHSSYPMTYVRRDGRQELADEERNVHTCCVRTWRCLTRAASSKRSRDSFRT